MGNVIFDDLEIDFSNMLEDREGFAKQCLEKAEELKSIMRGNTSISAHISKAPPYEGDYKEFDKLTTALYGYAEDNFPISAYKTLAKKLRKLADSIEYLATVKAVAELSDTVSVMDKATAAAQYSRLREAYNQWCEAVKLFDMGEFEKLKPMTGNYGGDAALVHYEFFFPGESEGYRMHLSVCRKLGIELRNLMDTIDYIHSHPETGVTIKQLTS